MSDDQVKLLIDGNECIGFGECVSEDPGAVEGLGSRARERALDEHTYLARARRLLELIGLRERAAVGG